MNQRQIWVVLIGLMSGMFLAALDQSVVSSAMRTIADDLDGLALQAWATTAYLITSTVSTPIYGKLGDIFGRRPLFMVAIGIFILGSLATGLAGSMFELAMFRAIQGLGAGGLFSLALTIVADIVPPRERARYQGMFLAVFGTSSVAGPVIGGAFAGVDEILFLDGWRWVFLMNLPIGAVSMFMVLTFLHIPHNPRPQKIDWWGAVTIVMAVVPILLVAEQGREWGWSSPLAIAMYVTGVTGIIAFIFIERRMGDAALLPLKIFKEPTFARTQLMGFIIGIGMFGGMITLPLILQVVYGASPTQAGLLMLPMVAGLMTASITSGRIMSKTGKYRIFFNVGTGLLLIGYTYMLLVLDATIPIWVVSIGMVIIGLGLGQLLQTTTVASQNSVHGRDIGVATSSITFFRQMGGTFGVAVFMSILFSQVTQKVVAAFDNPATQAGIAEALSDRNVTSDPANAAIIAVLQNGAEGASEITIDSSFLIGADDRLTLPFRIGFVESSLGVFLLATLFVGVAFVISFFIKEIPLRDKSAAQEAAESTGI
ncbi:MAG: MFS transporter [Aquiluna sp.]|uniref:MDR family MFS transporter n=1 Tax=Aquiluna sp. TaxID=2053504 RepID=UPI00274FD53F|nr:MFS transporter [Aquiluna sp.]